MMRIFREVKVKRFAIMGLLAVTLLQWGELSIFARDLRAETASQTLIHARLFAFGGIGFAGATSEGEKAFRVVMAEPHDAALQAMEEVFAKGGAVAKSYALVAIRALEPARFDALYQTVKHSQEKVPTMQGCIGRDVTLEDMTRDIRSGAYNRSTKTYIKSLVPAIDAYHL
jgi:hypothetical protein